MRIKKMLSFLAATTIAAGAFAGFAVTASAASVDDLATISSNATFIAQDEATAAFAKDTLHWGDKLITLNGDNGYSTAKGFSVFNGVQVQNLLQVKQGRNMAVKVSGPCTIDVYHDNKDTRVIQAGTTNKGTEYTVTKSVQDNDEKGTKYDVDSIAVTSAGVVYIGASGDVYVSVIDIKFESSGDPSTDPTPSPTPTTPPSTDPTPTPIPEVATPTPNPNAGKTLDDLTPIPTSVTSLSGDDFDIAFNTYYNAVSANGYLINGGKASSGNISSNQNVKIDGAVITGNYLDVKAGTADLTNTAKIFAFKPSADCTIKAYGRYDASKTSLRGFKLVAGENIATSEPVTDDDNSYNLATLNYSAASDGYVYIISQDSSIDAHIALIEFEWGSAPEPVETTEAGYTFKSTIEKLTTGTVTLTIVATNGQTEQEGTIDITDKLEGFSGELMLAVVINEIPEGVTITSASINLE